MSDLDPDPSTARRPPVQLGLIGAGAVAELHAAAAAHAPGLAVAAVCDPTPARARHLVAGDAPAFTSAAAMLAGARVDAVVITTPHATHADLTVAAARAGVHVLVEKPMATSLEDCDRMIAACAAAGVVLRVGHVQHHLQLVRLARDVVANGGLGDLVHVAERRGVSYEPSSRPAWFFDPLLAGGGVVLNVGTHGIDRMQWLTGHRITDVLAAAVKGHGNHGRIRRSNGSVETEAIALLRMDEQVTATLSVTGSTAHPFDEAELVFQHGTLHLSRTRGLHLLRDGDCTHLASPAPDDVTSAFSAQLLEFAGAIHTDEPASDGGGYGRDVVAVALAIYRAAASGRPTPLPPLTATPSTQPLQ